MANRASDLQKAILRALRAGCEVSTDVRGRWRVQTRGPGRSASVPPRAITALVNSGKVERVPGERPGSLVLVAPSAGNAYADRAGFVERRPNPLTGGWNSLYDAEPAGLDPDGGRWNTVCEVHGQICSHTSKATALRFLSEAAEWCEACMAGVAGPARWDVDEGRFMPETDEAACEPLNVNSGTLAELTQAEPDAPPSTTIRIPRNADYRDRATGGQSPCVICGRGVDQPDTLLELVDGGDVACLPGTADVDLPSYLGLHPIGSDCLHRHPELRPYVVRPARQVAR